MKTGYFTKVNEYIIKLSKELCRNNTLCKLLYYNERNAMEMPDLTQDQIDNLMHNQIIIIPSMKFDDVIKSYIVLTFNNFRQNHNNPKFIDNEIHISIICHAKNWYMDNGVLRPYAMMEQLHKTFENNNIGIGINNLMDIRSFSLDEGDFIGYSLVYKNVDIDRR